MFGAYLELFTVLLMLDSGTFSELKWRENALHQWSTTTTPTQQQHYLNSQTFNQNEKPP
jgi:hypothetical protein